MEIKTLYRFNIGGKSFRLAGLFRDGSKSAFAYRVYLGRRRWEPCDYPTIDYALKVVHGIVESRIVSLLADK